MEEENGAEGGVRIFQRCLEIETAEMDAAGGDISRNRISRLETAVCTQSSQAVFCAMSYFSFGLLKKKFTPLWPAAASLWVAVREKTPRQAWAVMQKHITQTLNQLISTPEDAIPIEGIPIPLQVPIRTDRSHVDDSTDHVDEKANRKRKLPLTAKTPHSGNKRGREQEAEWNGAEWKEHEEVLQWRKQTKATVHPPDLNTCTDPLTLHVTLIRTLKENVTVTDGRTLYLLENGLLRVSRNSDVIAKFKADKLLSVRRADMPKTCPKQQPFFFVGHSHVDTAAEEISAVVFFLTPFSFAPTGTRPASARTGWLESVQST